MTATVVDPAVAGQGPNPDRTVSRWRLNRTVRTPIRAYLIAWVVLTTIYLSSSGIAGRLAYDIGTLLAAIAIVVGVSTYRPRARLGWYLLAASMLAFLGAGIIQDYYTLAQNRAAPPGSWYDAVNLSGYAMLLAGVGVIVKARARLSRQAALDTAIFVVAFGSASWELVMEPVLAVPGASLPVRTVYAIYPAVDVLVVGLLACLLIAERRRPTAVLLLAFGMGAALVVDTIAAFSSQAGASWLLHWVVLGYQVSLVGFGVAALHPSMVALSEEAPAPEDFSGLGGLTALGFAVLLGPLELCVQFYAQHRDPDLIYAAATSAVLVPMVLLRMWWILTDLRTRDGRYRSFVQNSSDLTLVMDGNGILTYVSPASWPILGLTETQMIGRPMADFLHPNDLTAYDARGASRATSDHSKPVQARLRCGDGSYRLMEAHLTDLTDEPTVRGVVANVRDITESARLETELRHAQKLESVGQLASGIAHEINTPIQFVSDNVRFLGDAFDELLTAAAARPTADLDLEYLSAEVPQAVGHTLEGLDRVATIVRAMKAFGHPGTDEKSATDLNEAVNSALVVASNTIKQVADTTVELGDLPRVWCHPGDINQVLVNLIVNACHAMADKSGDERGTLTVRTALDGTDVLITVTDTGTGVPEAIAGRLFEPFFTTKEVGRGTGQGLALAYGLITDRHNGSLTFTSTPGAGTTFTIRLPIAEPATATSRS